MQIFHNLLEDGICITAKCKYCDVEVTGNKKIKKELFAAQSHDFDLIYNPGNKELVCCNEDKFIADTKKYYGIAIKQGTVKEDKHILAFLKEMECEYVI